MLAWGSFYFWCINFTMSFRMETHRDAMWWFHTLIPHGVGSPTWWLHYVCGQTMEPFPLLLRTTGETSLLILQGLWISLAVNKKDMSVFIRGLFLLCAELNVYWCSLRYTGHLQVVTSWINPNCGCKTKLYL